MTFQQAAEVVSAFLGSLSSRSEWARDVEVLRRRWSHSPSLAEILSALPNLSPDLASCGVVVLAHWQGGPDLTTILAKLADRDALMFSLYRLIDCSPHGVALVTGLVRGGNGPRDRFHAAYALTQVPSSHAIDALLDSLNDATEHPLVRGQAAEALAMSFEVGDVGPAHYEEVFQAVHRALTDRSATVRFWASFASGKLGDPRALPELENMAKADSEVCPGFWTVAEEAQDAIWLLIHGVPSGVQRARSGSEFTWNDGSENE